MSATLRLLRSALAVFAVGTVGHAAEQISPFMPPASVMVSTSPTESLEFAGINAMANKTYVNVYDKTTKKSRWIAVGETEKDITVLAYDPRREQIVVKTGAGQKTLMLRKGTGTLNAPTPVAAMPAASGFAIPTPPAPQPLAQPVSTDVAATSGPAPAPAAAEPVAAPKPDNSGKSQTIARQEEEARMLVSDLLEIGMAQRKAYEEAQKKAAAQQAEQQSAPPPATAPGT